MKAILAIFLFATIVFAQAPAAKKGPASSTPKKAAAATNPPASPRLLNPALLKAKAPDLYRAQFTTTKGDFVIEVHREWAPNGADRFYNLVKNGFYNNAAFFRAIQGFMVQFGIPANPKVAQKWSEASIKDDPVKQSNTRGMVTFAMAGPNSRTSQVFINFGDNSRLDGMAFAPFGTVSEGMDVVDKLFTGYGDAPRGPDQGRLTTEGKVYLDKNFPNLDSIKTAKIIFPEAAPASSTTKKAAPASATKK